MSWKKSLILILIFQIVIALVIYIVINKVSQIRFAQKEIGEYRGLFPDSGSRPVAGENSWSGFGFREGVRFFWQTASEPATRFEGVLRKNFSSGYRLGVVALGTRGIAAFSKRNKSYYLVVLVALPDRLLWIDLVSRGTIDIGFNYLGILAGSLEAGGKKIAAPGFDLDWSRFRKAIPFWEMQSVKGFFVLIFSIFLAVALLLFLVFSLSGAAPSNRDPLWEAVTPQVTVRYRRRFGMRSFPACLVKKGNEILILRFRKTFLTLSLEKVREEFRFMGRRLRGGDMQILFPDDESARQWQLYLSL